MGKKPVRELKTIPVIIGNCAPFRLVLRDGDIWNPTLEQINNRTYDYVKLNRMSTYVDIGINPFSLGIGFDGSLILPAVPDYASREQALNKFNETLGILMLGGIYSEAVHPTDISYGSLTLDGYVRFHGGSGSLAEFHSSIRSKIIGALGAIRLLNPQEISIAEFEDSYKKGKEIFQKIKDLNPSLLLGGTSKFVTHEWAESLIFLWTSIEQIINILWKRHMLDISTKIKIEGRKDFLKDHRTWTSSNKIEMLYQKAVIPIELYDLLNNARKTRNEFIHSAKRLEMKNVKPALEGLFKLISIIISDGAELTKLDSVIDTIYRNQRGDLFPKKTTLGNPEVTHWMPLPPLPGDKEWGNKEYEIIDDLMLRPLKK